MINEDKLLIGWPSMGGWLFVVRLSDPEPTPDGGRRRALSATNDEEQAQVLTEAAARVLLPLVREQRPEARIVFGRPTMGDG